MTADLLTDCRTSKSSDSYNCPQDSQFLRKFQGQRKGWMIKVIMIKLLYWKDFIAPNESMNHILKRSHFLFFLDSIFYIPVQTHNAQVIHAQMMIFRFVFYI